MVSDIVQTLIKTHIQTQKRKSPGDTKLYFTTDIGPNRCQFSISETLIHFLTYQKS